MNMKIFNDGIIDVFGMIEYIKQELNGVVPFISVTKGALGVNTIMLLLSFDPKENWNHGYVENSNYFRMMIDYDGVMEVFVQSIYRGSKTYENRIKTKFRKCEVKNKETVIKKLKDYIDKVKIERGE